MKSYVLVHGAFHGAWCWRRVTALLEESGAKVYAPTLTGLGERRHLASPGVGLDAHISDVVSMMEREDITGAVLVGHSYSGMVIAGAADRVPERIQCVVYLDAFVPEDGESLADIKGAKWLAGLTERAAGQGEGWLLPPPPAAAFDVFDEADAAWADSLLTPHPVKTFTDRVRLANPRARDLPHVYIACREQEDSFMHMREGVLARGWQWIEIATGHDAMITAPAELARELLRIG